VKLIVAVIRPEQLSDVLEALFHAEVRGLTISRGQGHGGEMEHVENYRGTSVKMALAEKVRLEIGVSNHFVQTTIDAILSGARIGEVGDGKIMVMPIEKIVRIRTGEEDQDAIGQRWQQDLPHPGIQKLQDFVAIEQQQRGRGPGRDRRGDRIEVFLAAKHPAEFAQQAAFRRLDRPALDGQHRFPTAPDLFDECRREGRLADPGQPMEMDDDRGAIGQHLPQRAEFVLAPDQSCARIGRQAIAYGATHCMLPTVFVPLQTPIDDGPLRWTPAERRHGTLSACH